jgi:hypothetical protein
MWESALANLRFLVKRRAAMQQLAQRLRKERD